MNKSFYHAKLVEKDVINVMIFTSLLNQNIKSFYFVKDGQIVETLIPSKVTSLNHMFLFEIKLKNDLIGGLNGWNEFYMNSEEGFSKNGIFYKITQGDGKFLYLELCDLFLEEDEKTIGHH